MGGIYRRRQPLFVFLLIIGILACQIHQSVETAWVTVPEDATLEEIAESLAVHGIVRSARSFRWYAKWNGVTKSFQPGVYDLPIGQPLARIAERLIVGVPPLDTMVIPAGVTLAEVAPMLERQVGVSGSQFWVAAMDTALMQRLQVRGQTVEGYLFPGTYYVRVGDTAIELLSTVADAFEKFWTAEHLERLDTLGFSRDEILTLASIIEGEVRFDSERSLVSSVYHNRLAAGMRLQADPTVIYALGERRRLFNRDYEVESPYNTYLIDGLPPHPINQPSAASIDAALYPDSTEYLYFVAAPGGRHRFSSSYAQHVAVIRQLRSP